MLLSGLTSTQVEDRHGAKSTPRDDMYALCHCEPGAFPGEAIFHYAWKQRSCSPGYLLPRLKIATA